eukprot:m.27177 g.27177  ORF g.27177 m.27177 type:complete len:292 (+) comp29831_c1_seq2:124-999(+)
MSTAKEPYARPKYSKPDMEKRRRARMNASLDELRNLLLSTLKMEGSRQSKLEKADILEMTVEHLRSLQRQRMSALPAGHDEHIQRYRQGYNECTSELTRYLMSCPELDSALRLRILAHMEVRSRSTNQLLQLKSEAANRAQAHQLPYVTAPSMSSSGGGGGVALSHPPGPEMAAPRSVEDMKPPTDGWQPSGSGQRVYAPVSLPFQMQSAGFPSPFPDQLSSSYVPAFPGTSTGTHDMAAAAAAAGYGGRLAHLGEYPTWMPMTPPDSAAAHYVASFGKGVMPGDEVWRPW